MLAPANDGRAKVYKPQGYSTGWTALRTVNKGERLLEVGKEKG